MVIKLKKCSEFGRTNANRSPKKQPTAFPRNGKFPPNYGIASPNFGKESYRALVKRLRG